MIGTKQRRNVERDKEIYEERKKGKTYREIGDRYGLSRSRVEQIVAYEERMIRERERIKQKEREQQKQKQRALIDGSIQLEWTDLSTRAYNKLKQNKINTLNEVERWLAFGEKIPQIGEKTRQEIINTVKKYREDPSLILA